MLFSILTILSLSYLASASAVTADILLNVVLSGPSKIDDRDDLKVTATLTNTGSKSARLLKDPRSILNTLETNSWTISNVDTHAQLAFIGATAKYVPTVAAAIGQADHFAILQPGETLSIEHDLSLAYNFKSSPAGNYSVALINNHFYQADPGTNALVDIFANDTEDYNVEIVGELTHSRRASEVLRRSSFNGCTSTQQSAINSAISAANTYATVAFNYLAARVSSTARYTTWFGSYTTSRHDTVQFNFFNIYINNATRGFSTFSYDCTCSDSGTYAYVYPDRYGQIYLCGAFWTAPTTGTDSKGGTLIHESSHFPVNGGTDDYAYGQNSAQNLATSIPSYAIMNADNYEYFAENNPIKS